ncbi:MAG: AMP-binding protein [Spirochaetia bacterium]|nr:AMP-binding protein [Spirochaetia bacterium]
METINDLGKYTFPALLANSIRKFGERPALTLIGGTPITYAQIGEKSVAVAKMLKGLGLKDGSKVAIFGTGRPEWGISYFGIVSYGMIAVPLLPDFSDTEIAAIFEHCGVDAVFVESKLYSKLEKLGNKLPSIVINLEDFKIIKGPKGCGQNITDYAEQSEPVSNTQEEDTASIIYTSGTTGRSKGVELTHKNLVWTCVQCQHTHRVHKLDRTLSFLPLSHVYEFTVSFSMQLLNGACVYYLGKPPIVSALLPAFKIVQPTIVLSVPLVMEKIYKNSVLPNFTKNNFIKFLYKMRGTQIILNRVAGKKLMKTFGGHLVFFGIGGAMIDPKVERFMKDAKFPYAIGYGLTETSPLLASSGPKITVPGCIGVVMPGVDLKINNPNPQTGVGEIVAKGENVMKGYYKDPELTKTVFTTAEDSVGEGYFKTGDLGIFVKHHKNPYLIIRGRNKNMILGPSGENIYPEDIEFVLNQHPLITESLVVEDDDGLVALVQLDEEKVNAEAEKRVKEKFKISVSDVVNTVKEVGENVSGVVQEKAEEFKRNVAYEKERITSEIQYYVNSRVNKSSKIGKVKEVPEFEKTATQKIKRYLYDLRTKVNEIKSKKDK